MIQEFEEAVVKIAIVARQKSNKKEEVKELRIEGLTPGHVENLIKYLGITSNDTSVTLDNKLNMLRAQNKMAIPGKRGMGATQGIGIRM